MLLGMGTASFLVGIVLMWDTHADLHVKREFVTPWEICDRAGLSFNTQHAAHRLHLRLNKSVASITRAALRLEIPDAETDKSISTARLVSRFAATVGEEQVAAEVERLIGDRFVLLTSGGRLQEMNGWMPLQDRLVAVELKLNRIAEALKHDRSMWSGLGGNVQGTLRLTFTTAGKLHWINLNTLPSIGPPSGSNCSAATGFALRQIAPFW